MNEPIDIYKKQIGNESILTDMIRRSYDYEELDAFRKYYDDQREDYVIPQL